MKSEAEVRRLLADLRELAAAPCSCQAEGHGAECRTGGLMLAAAIDNLAWVVGEPGRHESRVAAVARRAAHLRAERN